MCVFRIENVARGHFPKMPFSDRRHAPGFYVTAMAAVVVAACSGSSPTANGDGSNGNGGNGPDGGTSTIDGGASQSDASTDGAPACPGCARDWSRYPAVAELDDVSELWILSDVHGDYQTLTTLLAGTGVIAGAPATPADVQWNAGHAVLVVVGDVIDKGPDAPDAIRLFIALQSAAIAAGGNVIVTMGNHEAEFLADPTNSKADSSGGLDPELTSIGDTPADTAAGDNDIGKFIRDMPIAARVDDWFFVHAGKTDGKSVAQLASDLQSGIDSGGFGATVLSASDSLLEYKLSSGNWWDATGDATSLLTQWTTALGVKHVVMGHQPGAVTFADGSKRAQDAIVQKYGAMLFLVDTGMSSGVDNTGGAVVHVTNAGGASEAFQEVLPNGNTRSL